MNRLNKFVVFALVLFIGLGVACATGVVDAGVVDVTGSGLVSEVVSETSMDSGNLLVEDDVGNNEDIDDTNAVSIQEDVTITSNNVNQYTNKNWTVGSHVTLTGSDDISLDNVAINIAGNYVTLNNLNITTTEGHANYIINANNFTNLTVKNSALTIINNNENAFGICLKDVSGALIENVELTVNAPSKSMDWNNYTIGEGDDAQTIWYSTPSVGAIVSDNSSNLNIHNNTISISKNGNYNAGSTMPAIILRNQTRYSTVNDNTITASGSTYNYGIMCNDNVDHLDITEIV